MVGGVMFGNCEIGRLRADTKPARVITIEITAAKIGRSMKNLASTGATQPPAAGRDGEVGFDCPAMFCGDVPADGSPGETWGLCSASLGETFVPGRTRCSPLTMTRSPGFTPVSTTRSWPYWLPSVTGR